MVRHCKICKRKSDLSVTLFSFPKREDLKREWAKFCQITSDEVKPSDQICSLHFDKSAFKFTLEKGRRIALKCNATPTIFETPKIDASNAGRKYPKYTQGRKMNRSSHVVCCICGVIDNKLPRFGFPSDPEILKEWLRVSDMQESDLNMKSHKICFQHFTNDDFRTRSYDDQRYLLKRGAIPSLKLKQNVTIDYIHEDAFDANNEILDDTSTVSNEEQHSDFSQPQLIELNVTPYIPHTSTIERKLPRHINEIDDDFCGSSTIAKVILDVAKRDLDRRYRRLNDVLLENVRLTNKVATLTETIRYLREQKLYLKKS